jgi:diamine N-acetyltransferase
MWLNTNDITLRALEPEDMNLLYEWENDSELWQQGCTLSPYSRHSLRQYISDAMQQNVFQTEQLRLMIVIKETGETIGTADLYSIDAKNSRAGVGLLITKQFTGKGYGAQALAALNDFAFSFLHLHSLHAQIIDGNAVSIKLFEKCGFSKTGVFRQWIWYDNQYLDVLLYQLINQ